MVSIEEGKNLRFLVKPSFPRNNSVLYVWLLDTKLSKSENDSWASEYEYNPDFTEGDSNKELELRIYEGNKVISRKWIIDVINVNRPPVIDQYDPSGMILQIKEGESLPFSIHASDPDLGEINRLTYSWTLNGNFKSNMEFFEFKPAPESEYYEKGMNIIEVIVSDGKTDISWKWFIKVEGVNRPPKITNITSDNNWEVEEGENITFSITASDPNESDNLSYTWRISEINQKCGNVSCTYYPKYHDEGKKTLYVTVSDGSLSDSKERIFKVIDKNGPPIINNLSPKAELRFLFTWDNVYKNDNNSLINYLKDNLSIQWVENAEFIKNNNTIRVFKKKESVNITLDKEKANLIIDDGKIYNLKVKNENNTFNIYERYLNLSKSNVIFENFSVNASDPEGDNLTYKWESLSKNDSNRTYFNFYPDYNCCESKKEIISLKVNDGNNSIFETWHIVLEQTTSSAEILFLESIILIAATIYIGTPYARSLLSMISGFSLETIDNILKSILFLPLALAAILWIHYGFPFGIIALFFSWIFFNEAIRKLIVIKYFRNHFKWEDIPNSNEFRAFLKKKLKFEWTIEELKKEDENTLSISKDNKSIKLKLEDDMSNANLILNNKKIGEFYVNIDEYNKPNLFWKPDIIYELIISKIIVAVY
ncbi:MAG: hypothetical protein FIB07_14470 [Candidatus Methanoperedens sp.]|nr:hypothetical protein [Candidatus Methanoperedens sp.]